MPIPTVITDLSATAASNYPAGTDAPSVLDDVQRAHAAFIASIAANSGNGWVSPYLPLAGGTMTGAIAGLTNLTTTGNTALGDAAADTLSVGGSVIKNGAGNWNIPATSSGVALTVQKPPGTAASIVSNGPLAVQDGYTSLPASLVSTQTFETPVARFYIGDGTGYSYAFSRRVGSATASLLTIADGGNVTIAAPSSGVALTVAAVSGGTACSLNTTAASATAVLIGASSQTSETYGIGINSGSNFAIRAITAATDRLQISPAGAFSIAPPSAGTALSVAAAAGALAAVYTAGPVRHQVTTVASLLAAASAGAGAVAFVTDANATTFASIVAGGGANGVPVYSDGTNWRIG